MVKATTSVRKKDFAPLAAVRDRLDQLPDQQFVRGVVLSTGGQALAVGDRLEILPLAALWLPPGSRPTMKRKLGGEEGRGR